jgi:hypothetical protein
VDIWSKLQQPSVVSALLAAMYRVTQKKTELLKNRTKIEEIQKKKIYIDRN